MTIESLKSEEKDRPRLDAYFWAIALIWAGLIFAADSAGWLPEIGAASAWSWIFLGAGAVGLLLNFYSLSSPQLAKPTGWDYFWAGLLLAIGLGGFLNVDVALPVLLIVVGFAALGNALFRRH